MFCYGGLKITSCMKHLCKLKRFLGGFGTKVTNHPYEALLINFLNKFMISALKKINPETNSVNQNTISASPEVLLALNMSIKKKQEKKSPNTISAEN